MKKVFSTNKLFADKLTSLPNFFNFIESDFKRNFDKAGIFVVFNVLNLEDVNETYGRYKGDMCIEVIGQSISKVISQYNIGAFRFGRNDFLIILPGYLNLNHEEIIGQIENEFKIAMDDLGLTSLKMHKLVIEYKHEILSAEDFYDILIRNAFNQSKIDNDRYASERFLKHVICTFIRNVRDTLSCYNNAYDLAFTDDISGLLNHRAGEAYLYNLIEESKPKKQEFSLLFIDGDNLRKYNKISYEAGNEIIYKLSQIIKSSLRSEDKVYRWLSGDEFLIVLKGADSNTAIKLGERVKKAVENQTKECTIPTTVSVGVSCYPNDGDNIEDIINKAEKANRIAKNTGKNKVVIWDNSKRDK